jgi:hypothetical protein
MTFPDATCWSMIRDATAGTGLAAAGGAVATLDGRRDCFHKLTRKPCHIPSFFPVG